MTLIQRLNLILLLMVAMLLGLSLVVIVANARATVEAELDSSVKTVIQLMTATLISLPDDSHVQASLVQNISQLQTAQNLRISLLNPDSGASISSDSSSLSHALIKAPSWFVRLVGPESREYREPITMPGYQTVDIVVVADPSSEIEETWRESKSIGWLIVGFTLLSLLGMAMVIRRGLKPLALISDGLQDVSSGHFKERLSQPDLPDLRKIADQFNQLAQTLEQQQKVNQRLHGRMLQLQESERRKIAQDLHDDLGQSITAIKALAVAGDSPQSSTIVEVCGNMYESVRSLMHQLRPPLLDELGLGSALEKLVDDWNTVHEETFCALSIEGAVSSLSGTLSIHLFRCVQEVLNNVAKHADAQRVDIRLSVTREAIDLYAVDDGKGFVPDEPVAGMGLLGLRERAEACDGKFSLVTGANQGVSIHIHIPFVVQT